MKLLPQYSLRLMLGITTAVAGVFSVVGLAVRGHGWAIWISLGVAGIGAALLTYAAFFGILWVFSVVSSPLLNRQLAPGQKTLLGTSSPFAEASRALTAEQPIEAIVVDESDETAGSHGGGLQP